MKSEIWYYPRPLGKNKLGEILSQASKLLGNDNSRSRNKVANHSARKTSLSKLLDNNVSPLHVSQLSGHKNTDSLLAYHSASHQKQKEMSHIISNNSNANQIVPVNPRASLPASSQNSICKRSHPIDIPLEVQQQMVEEWDPVSKYNQKIFPQPILQGATFGANCQVEINIFNDGEKSHVQVKKRRRVVIDDDDSQ